MNIQDIKHDSVATNKPIIIAGPCSAESELQLMNIARQLAASNKTDLFRAGIWKPRTRPGTFEGVGTVGLKWLQQVASEYNLPCCTEIASPNHAYETLKHGIDTVWIGARTTTNPFLVQELANVLRETDVKVMIKNPVNPDIDLWTGAIERFLKSGIERIMLVHRGFSIYEKHIYRNAPYWEIALEIKKRFPTLPLICDPSHIGGDKAYLFELSSKAMALGYDGLMIETHPDPAHALSDKKQQITAAELLKLLNDLPLPTNEKLPLSALRMHIDMIDEQILETIEQRMIIAEKIGLIKEATAQEIIQPDRWEQVLQKVTASGRSKNLNNAFIKCIFNAIHQESIARQKRTIK